MSGIIRLFVSLALLIAAGVGIFYLWTKTLPPYLLETSATLGLLMLACLLITFITRPAGEKH